MPATRSRAALVGRRLVSRPAEWDAPKVRLDYYANDQVRLGVLLKNIRHAMWLEKQPKRKR